MKATAHIVHALQALAYDADHMRQAADPKRPGADSPTLPEALQHLARRVSLRAGDTVFRVRQAARHVHFLVRGRVVLYRYGPAGEQVAIHVAKPGEFFAEAALHADRYHCTAIAAVDCEVEAIAAAELNSNLRADPDLAQTWLGIMSGQLRQARARIERLSLKGASARLRHLLLTEGRGNPPCYELKGTVRELASELGITHEALYRTLAKMQRKQQIDRQAQTITLLR